MELHSKNILGDLFESISKINQIDQKLLMDQLQTEYRHMLLPHKLAYIKQVDKLIMRYLIYVQVQVKEMEVAL